MKRDYQASNSYHHPMIWKVRVYEVVCGACGWIGIEQLQEANEKAKAAQKALAEELKAGGYEIDEQRTKAPFFETLPMSGLKVEAEVVVVPKGERKDFDKLFNKIRKAGA